MQIEAGGEVIITQLFYDVERFIKFEKDCRSLGIQCPIVPGTTVAWLHRSRVIFYSLPLVKSAQLVPKSC